MAARPQPFLVEAPEGADEALATQFENIQKCFTVLFDDLEDTTGEVGEAEFIVAAASGDLDSERVITDSTSVTWDTSTSGQVSAKRAALTGDVTASANANATTIANGAVTFAKMQDIATDKLIGRDAAGSGDPAEIGVANSIVFDGSNNIQLSGDASAPGNSKYYGTSGAGTKGYHALPTNVAFTETITKASDETVTNSTTLQDDDELQFSVTAGSYFIELLVKYSDTDGTHDILWNIQCSAGTMTGTIRSIGLNASNAIQALEEAIVGATAAPSDRAWGAAATIRTGRIELMVTFTNDCTFKYRWCQNTGGAATSTVVESGSILRYQSLGT